jgi:hypothetical protein
MSALSGDGCDLCSVYGPGELDRMARMCRDQVMLLTVERMILGQDEEPC